MSLLILTIICTAAMLLMPSQSIDGAKGGIDLCINRIIPSLFPFFVCSRMMVNSGIAQLMGSKIGKAFEMLFGINKGCAFSFVAGLLCGYPVGAKIVGDMYKNRQCTKVEAQRMLAFCNNSGPLFIIGTVGIGMLSSARAGFILYFAHVLSAIATGILVRFIIPSKRKGSDISFHTSSLKGSFHDALTDSIKSMAAVCGNIIFFSVIISALNPVFIGIFPSATGRGLASGIIEISTGISMLSGYAHLPVIGFLLAWSGISVIMQVDGIIAPLGLSTPLFAITKLMQGILGGLFTFLLMPLSLPASVSYAANTTAIVITAAAMLTFLAIVTERLFAK